MKKLPRRQCSTYSFPIPLPMIPAQSQELSEEEKAAVKENAQAFVQAVQRAEMILRRLPQSTAENCV